MVSVTENLPAGAVAVVELLARTLGRVEKRFDEALKSDLPPVQRLVDHLETYRGKMLRPALVTICGLAARGNGSAGHSDLDVSDEHVKIAAVCEMIHMATLVHDDVLDEADTRRRGATVNRLRGNEAAVILGDYLFSSAYRLCASLPTQTAALLIGQTGMTLCAGELLQLHHRENFSIDEATYFEIVKRKTGSLIAVSCRLGAMQSGADRALADRFETIGMQLGIAFQIQDDLLDLTGNQSVVGKPLNRDVELGKLTLPMIHHLASASAERRGRTLGLLEADRSLSASSLREALEHTGSLAHARAKAEELVRSAKTLISGLEPSAARELLLHMADQVVTRSA